MVVINSERNKKCCNKELVDIRTVKVDTTLSKQDRLLSYLEQIKNPHNFMCNNIEVVARFIETGPTLEERLKGLML